MAFVKTERTKCGNCVFWDGRPDERPNTMQCHRFPAMVGPCMDYFWCGEFVDREPESNSKALLNNSPEPETLEWWAIINPDNYLEDIWRTREAAEDDLRNYTRDCRLVLLREAPSADQLLAALNKWAAAEGLDDWATAGCHPRGHMYDLLQSLGIPTKGV